MATGDLNIGGINLSPEDLDKLSNEITNRLHTTAKDPGQYEVAQSLSGISSIPVFQQSGSSYKLVRVLLETLKGVDGKSVKLRISSDKLQWANEGSEAWSDLYSKSDLLGEPGKNPVFREGQSGLEYKLEGEDDSAYKLLIPFSRLTGPAGDYYVFRVSRGWLQTKLSNAGEGAYINIFDLSTLKGDKGDPGPAPVLELGTVATVKPSDPASATFEPNGTDLSGANKYRLNLSIPKGKAGQDGTGAGNVLVSNEAALLAAKQYAFKPGQDGSVNGSFVEVEATEGAIEIPRDIFGLDANSTSDEIKAAIGGDEGFDELLQAMKANKMLYCILDQTYCFVTTYLVNVSDVSLTEIMFSFNVGTDSVIFIIDKNNDTNTYSFSSEINSLGDVITIRGDYPTKEEVDIIREAALNRKYVCLLTDSSNDSTPAYIRTNQFGDKSVDITAFRGYYNESKDILTVDWVCSCYNIAGERTSTCKELLLDLKGASQYETGNITLTNKGDGTKTLMDDGAYHEVTKEAPKDGKTYGRKDGAWSEVLLNPSASANIHHLDIDFAGKISQLPEKDQISNFGKVYTAPTSDNIVSLLGGIEGVRNLCEKLKPGNNPIVTVPCLTYVFPTNMVSTSVSLSIFDSTTNPNFVPLQDGCAIIFVLYFYMLPLDKRTAMVQITIDHFNTPEQMVVYGYTEDNLITVENGLTSNDSTSALSACQGKALKEYIDKKVGSEEVTTLRKLTQSAYQALSTKDSKTLYACIQTDGTIVMR